jgi:predicted membrane protein
MNYPIIPLIKALSGLSGLNIGLSIGVTFLVGIVGLALLIGNTFEPNRYDENMARWGFLLLGIAVFASVVGMAYILTFAAAAILLGLLVWILYLVLWRVFIANVIAAIWPDAHILQGRSKPKDAKKAKTKRIHGSGEGSS